MITVSLCMIVKNEEAVLARCLDSAADLCDEIIIVDTGSTDSTKQIAAGYTDKIYDYKWTYNFAEARNYAFSKCSMDYIYSADADELLDETNRQRFRILKEAMLPEIEIVQMWYLNTREYATTENYDRELRPKLYKRLRNFTWIDPIHESVNLEPVVYDSDVEIIHKPTSSHAGRDFNTYVRAVSGGTILSKKLLKMYARELLIAGSDEDFLAAKQCFMDYMNMENADEEARNWCYIILARIYRINKNIPEFFKYILKNAVTNPSSEVCCEIGDYYKSIEDYSEAAMWYYNAANETEPILSLEYGEEYPKKQMDICYKKMGISTYIR